MLYIFEAKIFAFDLNIAQMISNEEKRCEFH